jgi:uncharacterized protein
MDNAVHVAITRTVQPGCEEAFEDAIRSFFADTLREKTSLGAQLVRPLPGTDSRTYGILRSFRSELVWVVMPQVSRLARPWLR